MKNLKECFIRYITYNIVKIRKEKAHKVLHKLKKSMLNECISRDELSCSQLRGLYLTVKFYGFCLPLPSVSVGYFRGSLVDPTHLSLPYTMLEKKKSH